MKKRASAKGASSYLATGSGKLKLENYSAGKKLKTGMYIAVFGTNGGVKLLNTRQLLPAGVAAAASFAGMGKQLVETFDPQYGYGKSSAPGRFSFQHSNNLDTTNFGWLLHQNARKDEELAFDIFMGAFFGSEQGINYTVLEVHLYCDLAATTLAISVNDTEINYQFEPTGDNRVMLYLRKPADSNLRSIKIMLKSADNSSTSRIYITRVKRYTSMLLPPNEFDTLEV